MCLSVGPNEQKKKFNRSFIAMAYQAAVEGTHLSIIGQGIEEIPADLGITHGSTITELDFTENAIRYVSLFQFLFYRYLEMDWVDNNERRMIIWRYVSLGRHEEEKS